MGSSAELVKACSVARRTFATASAMVVIWSNYGRTKRTHKHVVRLVVTMTVRVAHGQSLHGFAPVAPMVAIDRLLGFDRHSYPCRKVRTNSCLVKTLCNQVSRDPLLGKHVALGVYAGYQPDHGFHVVPEESDGVDDTLRLQFLNHSPNTPMHGPTGAPRKPPIVEEVWRVIRLSHERIIYPRTRSRGRNALSAAGRTPGRIRCAGRH